MSKIEDRIAAYKKYKKYKKSFCESCGIGRGRRDENGFLATKSNTRGVLTVHHKDGDVKNNNENNLQTLCRKCHDKVHENKNRQ